MSPSTSKPPVSRLATGIRMATVIVVLGTLAAVWHPGTSGPAATVSDSQTSAPAASSPSADSAYFPSRFPAPENVEPQAPTF